VSIIESIEGVLGWDSGTFMSKNGSTLRAEQRIYLIRQKNEFYRAENTVKLLKEAEKEVEGLKLREQRNIELINRKVLRIKNLPQILIDKIKKQEELTREEWKKAREKNSYVLVKKHLEKLINLKKEEGNLANPDIHPYDTFLNDYEIGLNRKILDPLFKKIKLSTSNLLKKCVDRQYEVDPTKLLREIAKDQKIVLATEAAKLIGYNLDSGSITETIHPFTTGNPGDVRITIGKDNLALSILGATFHEGGHGIYQQNLPQEFMHEPIRGLILGAGMHESQSRFYETIIGQSQAMIEYFYPTYQKITGLRDPGPEELYKIINIARPTPIRLGADEISYNLHIILRYEIEKELFEEKITVDELPEIWKEKMQKLVGIEIKNDMDGILQDIHWYIGLVGYFPTYTLGNIYAAQFYNAMNKEFNVYEVVRKGEMNKIKEWLNEKVHNHGCLYDPSEIIEKATGEATQEKYLIQYLEEKYKGLYQF
ncbi:MAG: carboxypeptidase M32, partial [Candidatus Kariarchaeaceae archaeon]